MKRPRRLAASRDATPPLLAADAERFRRPFPHRLLPGEPLHPVGRDLLRRIRAAAASARDPRRRR